MKITKLKKDVNNIELCKIAAKNLGLKTERMRSGPQKTLLYVSDGKKFYLASAAGPGMFPEARRWNAQFTGSKVLSQNILKRLGYNVITSKEIRATGFSSEQELTQSLAKMRFSFPVLVKRDRGMNAKNIGIAEDRDQLIKIAKTHYKSAKDFMIQPIITNQTEYRVLVVNHKVVLMHSKHTYHLLGDGTSTIKELLADVIKEKTDPTYIKWQHKKLGTKPSTILPKGDKFEYHLTRMPNADFYATKNFPPAMKKWALQLAKDTAAPIVGIDVFVPGDFKDPSTYTIIELNTNPGLHYLVTCCNDKESGIRIFEDVLRDFFKLK